MCCVPSPLLVSACVPCVDCVQGGVPEPESGCNIEALRSAVDCWSEIQERQELQSLTVLASDIHCFCKSQLCACACVCVCVCVCVCLLSALSSGPDYVATITVYTYTSNLISTEGPFGGTSFFQSVLAGVYIVAYMCCGIISLYTLSPAGLAVECRGGFIASTSGEGMVGVKVTLRSVYKCMVM